MNNENKLVPDFRPETVQTYTEIYTPEGGTEQTATYKIGTAHPIISGILDKLAWVRTHVAAVWWNKLAGVTLKDKIIAMDEDIAQLNSKIFTTELDGILLKTVDAINNYYDTVSSSMLGDTHYIRGTIQSVDHPVLGGGHFLLEGFKTDAEYEWQKLTTYDNNNVKTKSRSKIAGVWKEWK